METQNMETCFVFRVVFVVSFVLLSAAQIFRMFIEYGINRFDYTG